MSDSASYVPEPQTIEYVHFRLMLSPDSFLGRLLYLVPHADPGNRRRLHSQWPWLVEAWERWMETPGGAFELPADVKGRTHEEWEAARGR